MKRIYAFVLLVGLSASALPATAQIFTGPGSSRKAQKAANKEHKASEKRARKQSKQYVKAMKKYDKNQRKLPKK